jgi:hypothetical protein
MMIYEYYLIEFGNKGEGDTQIIVQKWYENIFTSIILGLWSFYLYDAAGRV